MGTDGKHDHNGCANLAWYKIFPKKYYYNYNIFLGDPIDVVHYYPVQQREGFKYYLRIFYSKGGKGQLPKQVFLPFLVYFQHFTVQLLTWVNFFWDQIGRPK